MGRSIVDGHHVYGKFYAFGSFGPTNISRKTFLEHKGTLEEIEITQEWLLKKTGKRFPTGFKTTELHSVDFDVVIKIASLLGIKYIKSKKPSSIERSALRRSVIKSIDSL
jgi:hypothetical protein